MKRGFDILISLATLVILAPILVFATVGIRLSSRGPVFYRARRVGVGGEEFNMLKFRSMHSTEGGPVITSYRDQRIFPFGLLLRKLKIDELPQLLNVLRGDMSIVGPRPEDPKIVSEYYTDWMKETLDFRPGITSPGAIFYYACCEVLVDPQNPELTYVEKLLPPKLAIERAYLTRATLLTDTFVIFHTAVTILGRALGLRVRPSQKDIAAAQAWVSPAVFELFQ